MVPPSRKTLGGGRYSNINGMVVNFVVMVASVFDVVAYMDCVIVGCLGIVWTSDYEMVG